jgi:hypothetical protein
MCFQSAAMLAIHPPLTKTTCSIGWVTLEFTLDPAGPN